MQCSFFNIEFKPTPPPDFKIEDQQELDARGVFAYSRSHARVCVFILNHKTPSLGTHLSRFCGQNGFTGGDFGQLNTIKKNLTLENPPK